MAQITFNPNQITSPVWAGDFLNREHLVPGGAQVNPALFNAVDAVVVTVTTPGAAALDTDIGCEPLSGPIPVGTVLDFGGVKFATLTQSASAGDTFLVVRELPNNIAEGDTATYKGVGKVVIPTGTPVGRTFDERAAGEGFGPATEADDEVYLVAFEVPDAERSAEIELYRHGSVVKENFLPGYAALDPDLLTLLRSLYTTTIGAD